MALSVATIGARSLVLAPDPSGSYGSDEHDANVPAALLTLSRYEPQTLYVDLTGDGSSEDLTLSSWLRTYKPTRLEYEIDEDDVEAVSWTVVRSGDDWVLRCLDFTVANGEDARLWYQAPHTSDGTDTTVDDDLLEPVALFCAAITLRQLAVHLMQADRSGLAASSDLMDLRNQSNEARQIAKDLDRQALELLGVVQDDARAVSGGGGAVSTSGDVAIEHASPPWREIGL